MKNPIRVFLAAATLVAILSGCDGCGKSATTQTGKLGPDQPGQAVKLAPLPEPPALNITPNELPGADGALAVVAVRPKGEAVSEVRPTVTFNKPVKSLEQVEAQRDADKANPFATIEPALEGEWRWLGSASAEFVPKGLVPFSTDYTVTIHRGLAALDGSKLADDSTFTFSTPRLELQSEFPRRTYRWLKPDEALKLTFNQALDEATLIAGAHFEAGGATLKLQVLDRISVAEQRKKDAEARGAKQRRDYDDAEPTNAFTNRQMVYTVAPEKPFPRATTIVLELDPATLRAKEGKRQPKGDHLNWSTYSKLEWTGLRGCQSRDKCPYGPLTLFSSNEITLESLKSRLKIEPAVEIDWDATRTWAPDGRFADQNVPYAEVQGKFRPGTTYRVTIAAGVTDVFGQAAAEKQDSFKTDDLSPALVTGGALALVEATGEAPQLPVEVSNLKSLTVQMWKLTVPELVRATIKNPYDESPILDRAADFSELEQLTYPKNAARVHPLKLSKLFGDKKTGVALVSVNSTSLEYQPKTGYRQVAQVTDLAIHLKVGPKSSLAWVTRLSTGAPVEGADLTLYDDAATERWKGKTDARGMADVPGTAQLKIANAQYQWEYPKVVAVAKLGDDLSFTADTWASGVEPYEFGLDQGWEADKPAASGFVFTDRGIYRPGDPVHVKAVMRWREVGDLRAAEEGSLVTIKVNDSASNEVFSQNVKVTKYGTLAADVTIPKEAPLGWYSIEAKGSAKGGPVEITGSFRVEEYRAPQFRVDVETPKKSLLAGEGLEARVFARYLFGGAMGNSKAKWSVVRKSTEFTTPVAPDFTFGTQTWWWDDGEPHPTNGFFASGDGLIDVKGELALVAGKVEAPGDGAWTYTVEGEVEDVNRQTVAGRIDVAVHPAAFYVGLRAPTGFMQVGTEYALDTLVVNPEGNRVAGRAVDVQILRRTWKSVKRKEAGGGFTTVSEPAEEEVQKCAVKSLGDAPVPCKFKPAVGGFFIVKGQVKDDQGRKHAASIGAYVLGAGFAAWQRNDTDRIELVPDKTKYDVGDVAKVLVKSPYPNARALVTVEREGVLERRVVDLKGSMEAVEVTITEAMVPNIFVGVLLVRPRVAQGGVETGDDPGRPVARIGFTKLNVERAAKRLAVKVTTDQPAYQPGQDVNVQLSVLDRAGKPTDAEVTLYVVDEAVLRLTDYKTPDPIAAIFPDRPLSVRLGEPLLHLVRRRSYGEKGEAQGGGGGEGAEGKGIRTNFKTTALWLPTLEVKGGVGSAKFKLPDNLTTFRVMAVAITQGERFGSGETSVQVSKPVLGLPALPRFARVGDTFEAGVVVHTHGTSAGEVTVKAEVTGVTLQGPAEQKVQVAEGSPQEVRFTFLAEKPGPARFRFRMQKGADSDAVEETIPVELPMALESVATYGDTETQSVEGVVPPKSVYENEGGLTVTLASTSLTGLDQGFRQLIEYPYGCLEQQSSRLVPFIALREIAGQYGIGWTGGDPKKKAKEDEFNTWLRTYFASTLQVSEAEHPDQIIAATVRSIVALQDGSGGFRYWPDSTCTGSWVSAYATLALSRAKDVGYTVPAQALSLAEGYLARVAGGSCACEHTCSDESRAFAVYVLAKMKKPKPSFYGNLYASRDKLSLFSRALLANAMATGGGDRKQANALLDEILNFAKESPKGVSIAEANSLTYATTFQSDTRTTGVVLQTLVALSPNHPYVGKMARHLSSVRQGDGHWRTTQEAAFSLMALTDVMRIKEKDTPDFQARVALGASSLVEQAFKGRSMKVETKVVPMPELQKALAGADTRLTFGKTGPGVLYYSALLRYAPKEMPTAALDAGLFVQRWFEPYAGGGQATRFNAGELVRVRVRVASNQERHWLAVEVPLPAGLEAVDSSLATSAKNLKVPDDEGPGEGYEPEAEEAEGAVWGGGFYSPFEHLEHRDSKLLAFADHLPAGVHLISFVARATTPGSYVLKPARGELMYEPEVWGRSEGGRFEVSLPIPLSQR